MAFKKGKSGNPAGRPVGVPNKNYLNAGLWLSLLWDDVQTMDAKERAPIMKWAVEQILAKVQVLPATPGESASNGAETFKLMNGLAPAITPVPANPAANGNGSTNGNGNGNGQH